MPRLTFADSDGPARCWNCAFFAHADTMPAVDSIGECCRYPPPSTGRRVQVSGVNYCGEWLSKATVEYTVDCAPTTEAVAYKDGSAIPDTACATPTPSHGR